MLELSHEALQARREYLRDWGAKNKEKRKAANARYWARYAERKKAEQLGALNGPAPSVKKIIEAEG